jgi:hypothetical protein
MPILKLLAQLGLDKTGFDAGVDAADKKVKRFGSDLKSTLAGAFGAAAVTAFVKSIIETGGHIKDLSDRLGVGTDEVQEFGLAAQLGGQDAEIFARAIEKIRVAMVKGADKGENPLSVFGITMQQLKSGDAVGILRQLAVQLENFAGSAEQTKALMDVFGAKGAGAVVNMLRELKNAKDELKFTREEIEKLDRAGDSLIKLWGRLKVLGASLFIHPDAPLQKGGMALASAGLPDGLDGVEAAKTAEIAAKAHMATQGRILDIEKEIKKTTEENRVENLNAQERLLDLAMQREAIFSRIAKTDEQRAQKQLDLANNEKAIIGLNKKEKIFGATIGESSLGSIGAFTGPATNNSKSQVEILNRIHNDLFSKGIYVKDTR